MEVKLEIYKKYCDICGTELYLQSSRPMYPEPPRTFATIKDKDICSNCALNILDNLVYKDYKVTIDDIMKYKLSPKEFGMANAIPV
jgi:hypothetical protein